MEEALTHGEPLFGVLVVTTVLHLVIGPVLVSGIQRQSFLVLHFPVLEPLLCSVLTLIFYVSP